MHSSPSKRACACRVARRYQDWNSPYYNDSHRRYRAAVREFVENEMMPYTHEWDEKKQFPKELFQKCAAAGVLGAAAGAVCTHHLTPFVSLRCV
jgi:alkylation response protein AidB-like acyl-CoA dehydrogenase